MSLKTCRLYSVFLETYSTNPPKQYPLIYQSRRPSNVVQALTGA